MSYTQEEINRYMEILKSYTQKKKSAPVIDPSKCIKCQSKNFVICCGHRVCDDCGISKGPVLGYFDIKEYDRLHYKKKVFIGDTTTLRKRLTKFLKE